MSIDAETHRQLELSAEAAAWLIELESASQTDVQVRFQRWLERSADHVQAFLEMTATDRDLNRVDPERRIDIEALILELKTEKPANVSEISVRDSARPSAMWSPRTLFAASVTVIALLGGALAWRYMQAPVFTTAIGEQRTLKLQDGSLMQLNTRSRVEVRFSRHSRDVRLLGGEALFVVEQDVQRPFRVLTNNAAIRALGTQFNVYTHDGATTVSVLSGRVLVSAAEDLVVGTGEEAVIERQGEVIEQPAARVDKAIAWRQRQLSFDHATLEHVVEQFNRYNRVEIRVEDRELRARQLDGVFDADQPSVLIDFMARDPRVVVERSEGKVVIRKR